MYFECMELYNYALLSYILLKDTVKIQSLKEKGKEAWKYIFSH